MITRDQAVELNGKLRLQLSIPVTKGILAGYDFPTDQVQIALDLPGSPKLWLPRTWVDEGS